MSSAKAKVEAAIIEVCDVDEKITDVFEDDDIFEIVCILNCYTKEREEGMRIDGYFETVIPRLLILHA